MNRFIIFLGIFVGQIFACSLDKASLSICDSNKDYLVWESEMEGGLFYKKVVAPLYLGHVFSRPEQFELKYQNKKKGSTQFAFKVNSENHIKSPRGIFQEAPIGKAVQLLRVSKKLEGHRKEVNMPFNGVREDVPQDQVSTSQDSIRTNFLPLTLEFSTFWGATGGATNRSVAVDSAGNVYMAGGTSQPDWPSTLGRKHCGDSDVTVAKFDPNGNLLWSTLIGGPSEDYTYVSAVGPKGELYISGRAGEGFPTTPGAFDRTFNGGMGSGGHSPTDAFVVKLSSEGQIIYSTYIGGNGDENGRAIHLLPSGKLIVGGGNTTATDLPTDKGTIPGPVLKLRKGGNKDSWVAVVAEDGKSLDFLTYFGPDDDSNKRGDETIRALGVDAVGNIWIGGTTQGSDMTPTPDAFQKLRGGPPHTGEAYIAKISPDGKKLVYFSWLGGDGPDEIETEGVSDNAGNFYVAGSTGSRDFPTTPGAFQSILKGSGPKRRFADGWVAKVNNNGTLGFATLYGGSTVGSEGFFGPVVDGKGNVYCTGRFRSDDIPVTSNAFQPRWAGKQDTVLAIFSPDGKKLLYGTYFGGSGIDHGRHIGMHSNDKSVYVIGETNSPDIPLIKPQQNIPAGAFLARFLITPDKME